MVDHDPNPYDPQDAFDELARITLADHSMESVMSTVADVCIRLLPHADEASVSLLTTGRPTTVAFTGPLAVAMDERQYEHPAGPCLTAAATETVQLVVDAQNETRWPAFAAGARRHGVCSSLSVPVLVHSPVAAGLNIYSTRPAAFGEQDVQMAQAVAAYAGVALANMHLFQAQLRVAENLKVALESRAVIEQAKGLIVGIRGCSAEEAFEVLVSLSQDTNRKLREVAQTMIDSARGSGDASS